MPTRGDEPCKMGTFKTSGFQNGWLADGTAGTRQFGVPCRWRGQKPDRLEYRKSWKHCACERGGGVGPGAGASGAGRGDGR